MFACEARLSSRGRCWPHGVSLASAMYCSSIPSKYLQGGTKSISRQENKNQVVRSAARRMAQERKHLPARKSLICSQSHVCPQRHEKKNRRNDQGVHATPIGDEDAVKADELTEPAVAVFKTLETENNDYHGWYKIRFVSKPRSIVGNTPDQEVPWKGQ